MTTFHEPSLAHRMHRTPLSPPYDDTWHRCASLDQSEALEQMPPALEIQLALTTHRKLVGRAVVLKNASNASLVQVSARTASNDRLAHQASTLRPRGFG